MQKCIYQVKPVCKCTTMNFCQYTQVRLVSLPPYVRQQNTAHPGSGWKTKLGRQTACEVAKYITKYQKSLPANPTDTCPMLTQSLCSLKDAQVNGCCCVSGTASLWGAGRSTFGFHLYLCCWRAFSITQGALLPDSDLLHEGTFLRSPRC